MPCAPTIILTQAQWTELQRLAKQRRRKRLPRRTQLVVLAALGLSNRAIAESLKMSLAAVGLWRWRFFEKGTPGLLDMPRPGRPRVYGAKTVAAVLRATRKPPPERPCWSTRTLAKELGIPYWAVHRIWSANGLTPLRNQAAFSNR